MTALSQPLNVSDRVVIIGAGQGAFQFALSLRDDGFRGRIDMIGDEPHLPYQRPPLSKDYLAATPKSSIALREIEFFAHRDITVRMGTRALEIDRVGQSVRLSDGGSLYYDRLVLATGARARQVAIDGSSLAGVVELRTRDDADRLREHTRASVRAVTVGGGFIGLEIAAALRGAGSTVTVLEQAARLMPRVSSAPISEFLRATHEAEGTRIRLDVAIARIVGDEGKVAGVELADGELIPADLVLVAAGVIPNAEIAAESGLVVDNGIVVDEFLGTDDPRVFAIGDCANFPSIHASGRVRLESVQNAVDQGRHLARELTSGEPAAYVRTPWFWSHQYAHRLQIVGVSPADAETVVVGTSEKFSVLSFADGVLKRIESVNDAGVHLAGRKLMDADLRVTRTAEEGADYALRALL